MKVIEEHSAKSISVAYHLMDDNGTTFFSTIVETESGWIPIKCYADPNSPDNIDDATRRAIDEAISSYMQRKSALIFKDHINSTRGALDLLESALAKNDINGMVYFAHALRQNILDIDKIKFPVKAIQDHIKEGG